MEWGINDTLKSRAYGHKKEGDFETKHDKIAEYEQKGGHYYPADREGKFDEWGAMVKHMTARHQIVEQEKKDKQRRERGEYQQFLDQQRLEKLQQKMQDQTLKKHEYDLMVQKDKVLQQLNSQKTVEDRNYQSYLKNQYQKNIDENDSKKKLDRGMEIEEERNRQDRVKRDLEIEKMRNMESKEKLKLEMDIALKYNNVMTDQERQLLERNRKEWQQLCEQNSQKEIQREDQYRRFFKDFENDMQRRMNQHIDHVLKGEVNKQSKQDLIEQTNENKYKQWQDQKEKFEKDIRMQGLRDMHHTNRQLMDQQLNKVNQDRTDMKRVIEDRHKDESDYRQFERTLKDQDRDRRKIYKDTLDHQMKIMDLQKHKYGTMTDQEKRMNRLDLHNYKSGEVNMLEAMIPGIHNLNTVGTSPLKRGATQILSTTRQNTSNTNQEGGEQNQMHRTLGASQSMKVILPYNNQSPMRNEIKAHIIETKENSIDPDKYNPITNPLPWINQNPYIQKEKHIVRASNRSTLLLQ